MATKKKSSKSYLKRVHRIMESDLFKSLAITSILFNLLFLVGIFVLTSNDTFDRGLYLATRDKYCSNLDGVRDRAEELGDENAAIREWQVSCEGKDFKPYFNEAIEKYKAQTN